jgi:P-type Cu+ transporter
LLRTAALVFSTFTQEDDMADDEQVIDPVCHMKINKSDAVATEEHEGTTYYFCSQDCADSFRESPEDYV